MTKIFNYNLLVALFFFSLTVKANFNDLNLGLGLMNEAASRYQTDESGGTKAFDPNVSLVTGLEYEWNPSLSLFGKAGYVFSSAEESYISKNIFFLSAYVGTEVYTNLTLQLGSSFYFTRVSGDGGTVALRNGDGTTSFNIPKEATISRNVTLNFAANYAFLNDYSTTLEVFTFNPLISEKRTANILLTFNFHFKDDLWRAN